MIIKTSKKSCAGAGLIEVMVAVVVMSIGALGMAVLQVQSKMSNHQAIQRSAASMLAHDIAERLRANTTTGSLPTSVTFGGGAIATEPTPICDSSQPCTPFELAAHDIWEWEGLLDGANELKGGAQSGGLTAPTACITGTGATGAYTIAIAWRGQRSISDPSSNACGSGTGRYDDVEGNADALRHVLVLDVFIDAS